MADENTLNIKVVATGGDAAAADVAKPTAAITEQTAAITKNTEAVKVSAGGKAEHARISTEAAAALKGEAAAEEELNATLIQRQAIESTLAEAAALRAGGNIEGAAKLEAEAEVMALSLKYQTQLKLGEAEATALAKQRLTSEAKIAELKAAEVAQTKAATLAEKEGATATAAAATAAATLAKEEAAAAASAELHALAAKKRLANVVQTIGLRDAGLGRGGNMAARGLEGIFGLGGGAMAAVGGIAITAAAVIGLSKATHDAAEEGRKMDRAFSEASADIAAEMLANPVSALNETRGKIRAIGLELEELHNKWVGAKIFNFIKEGIGIEGDAAKQDRDNAALRTFWAQRRQAAQLAALDLEEEANLIELQNAGLTEQAEIAKLLIEQDRERARIEGEIKKNQIGEKDAERLRAANERKNRAEMAALEKKKQMRDEAFSKEYEDAEASLKILQLQGSGNGPAAALAKIEKERLDTLIKINKQLETGAITEQQAAIRKAQTEKLAREKQRAESQDQFRKDFAADVARSHESNEQRAARMEANRQQKADDRAQIQRNISKQEAEMANGKWEKDEEGKDKWVPGRSMTEAEKAASRKAQEAALRKDREAKKERHSKDDLPGIGADEKPGGDALFPWGKKQPPAAKPPEPPKPPKPAEPAKPADDRIAEAGEKVSKEDSAKYLGDQIAERGRAMVQATKEVAEKTGMSYDQVREIMERTLGVVENFGSSLAGVFSRLSDVEAAAAVLQNE